MSYTALRLCASHAAFEAIPQPRRRLELDRIRARIEAEGIPVIDARVLLLAGARQEVTIGRDGRILIKLRDRELAEGWFAKALVWVGGEPDRPRGAGRNP